MEVQSRGLIAEIVFKIDGDSIADISRERWRRPLTVDRNQTSPVRTFLSLNLLLLRNNE